MPKFQEHLKNVSKRNSPIRKSPRSYSNDSNWNENNTKTRTLTNKHKIPFRKSTLRDDYTKPKTVRSKSSQRPSQRQHSNQIPKLKGKLNSKSSVAAPIRFISRPKPDYRWIPKVLVVKTPNVIIPTVCNLNDKQDMSWETVNSVDSDGKPSHKMDWVPKSN